MKPDEHFEPAEKVLAFTIRTAILAFALYYFCTNRNIEGLLALILFQLEAISTRVAYLPVLLSKLTTPKD